MNPCYNFNLVQHLEQLLLPRICLFDRELLIVIDNWQYWILAMVIIDNGH